MIARRDFLIGATGASVGFGLGGFSHRFPLPSPHFGPDWHPGAETFVPSTCLLCPSHCGIRAHLVDGAVTRVDGNPLHPVSQGGLCPKGRAGVQLLYHPSRVRGPMQRVGPRGSQRFEPIAWEAALDRVAAALRAEREAGNAGSVEWLVGDATGVMADLIAAFCGAYGTDRVSVDDYRDGAADVLRMCQGIALPPAYDLAASDFVLSFGAGLAEAWWGLPQAARARGAEPGSGPRWVQVDVRLSRTALAADEWIPLRPGAHGVLALGLLYLIAKEGLYDAEALAGRVAGWEDWVDGAGVRREGLRSVVLRHGRPDDVSARTDVPVPRLVSLAKAFGTARSPVAIWDHAVSWRNGGLADALTIHALNVLTGRLNRPGGVLVQPALPLPGPLARASEGTRKLAEFPLTATHWPRPAGPHSKVLFLYRSNPVASGPRAADAQRALADVPLVVSFSPFFDESTRHADLLLPDHTDLERWQDALAPPSVAFPVWGLVQPAVEPLQDTRSTGDVILSLAARLGGEVGRRLPWSTVEEIVRERGQALAATQRGSAFVDSFRRHELRELESRGWWLPHGESSETYWQAIASAGGWFDPIYDYHDRAGITQHADGRVWVFPVEARERLRASTPGLREGFLPAGELPDNRAQGDGLSLVVYRAMTLASGGLALTPWLLEHLGVVSGAAWEAWAEIHPRTAHEQGLADGQRVRVESARGSFELRVRVVAGAQPGVVNVPYGLHSRVEGWGEPRVANPLAAIGAGFDPASQLPDWGSTRVRLTRL